MAFDATMQVLTLTGWRSFEKLGSSAMVAVPDPKKHSFKFEKATLKAFDTEEPLVVCENERMTFRVTTDQDIVFSRGETKSLEVCKAADFSVGDEDLGFSPMGGYAFVNRVGEMNPAAQFATFWCGDGYKVSKDKIGFGLKKDRKKAYLTKLLKALDAKYEAGPHKNRPGYLDFTVELSGAVADAVKTYIQDHTALAAHKHIRREALADGDGAVIRGLFDGLMNSDGHIKQDRPQLQFTSTSIELHRDFQLLSAMLGRDSHFTKHSLSLSYDPEGRTALKAASEYLSKRDFTGRIYSAKTSNGLMLVRGDAKTFAFVASCGDVGESA